MRLALITDLHVDLSGQESFGVDTAANTLAVLAKLAELKIDHLVVLGDICLKKPQIEVYTWFHVQLKLLGVPYTIIPGNHDDLLMMEKELDLDITDGHHFGMVPFENFDFLCLDTSPGLVSMNQLSWLGKRMEQSKGPVQFVLMHHPPCWMDVPYMDSQHSLQNGAEVMEIFQRCTIPVVVYCGHYHVEKERQINHVRTMVSPSCYFQLDSFCEDFKIDHHQIAFRILDLEDSGVRSSLHYLPGHLKG